MVTILGLEDAGSLLKNTILAALGAPAHHMQHLTAHFIQNGRRGPKIAQILGYWTLNQLSLNKFFDSIIPSMRTLKIQNGRIGSGKRSTPDLNAKCPDVVVTPKYRAFSAISLCICCI